MYQKKIVYDRVTQDFAMYLNGELIGYRADHHVAETHLNNLVDELLRKESSVPATWTPEHALKTLTGTESH